MITEYGFLFLCPAMKSKLPFLDVTLNNLYWLRYHAYQIYNMKMRCCTGIRHGSTVQSTWIKYFSRSDRLFGRNATLITVNFTSHRKNESSATFKKYVAKQMYMLYVFLYSAEFVYIYVYHPLLWSFLNRINSSIVMQACRVYQGSFWP